MQLFLFFTGESVEMFLDLSKATREKHIRVMKIYLLSPFLFDIVEQDDKVGRYTYNTVGRVFNNP